MKKRIEPGKAMLLFVAVNIIQIGALVLLLIYSLFSADSHSGVLGISSPFFIIVITITSLINTSISIRDMRLLSRAESQFHLLQDTLSKVENLNHSLRAQRHDFLNHLQVVYGLIEMEEYSDARDYIDKVYKDIQKVSRALKTAIPAVNALLQAKMMDAGKRDIQVHIDVSSRLEGFPIPSWEFCRVLGNLLDNAIAALEEKTENRLLNISLKEDLKVFLVRIEDNGPMIPADIADKIFNPGFTTKKGQGEGMGLAITRRILDQYGGDIEMKSDEGSTVFTVSIPKAAAGVH